ncbi:hypothetical protein OMF50_09885, partial [Bordetella pertussis]
MTRRILPVPAPRGPRDRRGQLRYRCRNPLAKPPPPFEDDMTALRSPRGATRRRFLAGSGALMAVGLA